MKPEKILLIVNPCSGTGKIRGELLSVVDILTRGGCTVTVYPTAKQGDARDKVANLKEFYDTIVCCGGDGTLNEVINGALESGKKYTIGYIPSGTLNEWSLGLGISKNIEKAARDILNGRPIFLDIGRFGDRYFTYTASFGAFTSASYSASQDVKNILGQAAYFFEGIKSIGNIKPIHMKFSFEEESCEGDYIFGAISNSMSVGGILKLDKSHVSFNDGLFEVILIEKPDNIADLNKIIDSILKKDFTAKCIKQFKSSNIKVTMGDGVSWTLDGEYAAGSDPVIIQNLNCALEFIVPKK